MRREELTDKFALKMSKNPRYSDLFPLRPQQQLRVRNPKPYLELKANTARLYNSPLFYMRRRLNALAQREGGTTAGAASGNDGQRDIRCDFIYDEWR